jgi:outer membrane protein OmpA-like peptidoglycan-associated protein
MKLSTAKKPIALAIALCMTGCDTIPGQLGSIQQVFNNTFSNSDPCSNNSRNLGTLIGGGLGAILGNEVSKKDPRAIALGTALGAGVGALIGAEMDRKRCDMSRVARQYNLDMKFSMVTNDGTVVNDAQMTSAVSSEETKRNTIGSVVSVRDQLEQGGHFEVNSDVLTSRAHQYFAAIADSYNASRTAQQIQDPNQRQQYMNAALQRKLMLIGHTDDTGSSHLNADLSERRARAVGIFLEQHGIPRDSIYYQGAGEVYPIADNNTESGRAQNRRVEIVELADEANFQKYLAARKPNYRFYRAVPSPMVGAPRTTAQPGASRSQAPPPVASGKPGVTDVEGAGREQSPPSASARPPRQTPPVTARPAPGPKTLDAVAQTHADEAPPPPASAPRPRPSTAGQLDFGGVPLTSATGALQVGKIQHEKEWFSLVSTSYADEPAVLSDCSKDRPRINGAVKALKNGAVYAPRDHVRGLYGKSWADRVNGHLVVINKVAVLANQASLAQLPDFMVFANYNPGVERNPKPTISIKPEVNTYLGDSGILYRVFAAGTGGVQCVDVLYSTAGGATAKGGKIVYDHDQSLYVAEFKPSIVMNTSN